ncbi:hypothetical protein [Actinomadura sp. WMMB 499]|uniref:hypothetical protein n=1 Tax=Actinomadura sp. WMMB 499 TaxID=1219491 RepID=UPI00124673C5|nr:hypothetical protein [Actinomadura sp. WMMB 499]QFG22485.1 hypothetical protein F7P10_16495 [Actinomadura sp. WMMB 499]
MLAPSARSMWAMIWGVRARRTASAVGRQPRRYPSPTRWTRGTTAVTAARARCGSPVTAVVHWYQVSASRSS